MAKKKQPAADETPLTDGERKLALKVLRSQGRAVGCFASLPVSMQRALASYCDVEGNVRQEAVEGVRNLFMDYHAELKAVVDEPA